MGKKRRRRNRQNVGKPRSAEAEARIIERRYERARRLAGDETRGWHRVRYRCEGDVATQLADLRRERVREGRPVPPHEAMTILMQRGPRGCGHERLVLCLYGVAGPEIPFKGDNAIVPVPRYAGECPRCRSQLAIVLPWDDGLALDELRAPEPDEPILRLPSPALARSYAMAGFDAAELVVGAAVERRGVAV